MWMMTRYGFYSITAANQGMIQVRARNRQHLVNLQKAAPEIAGKDILKLQGTDYMWRIIVKPEEWVPVAAMLASEVGDYKNFKGECAKQVDAGNLDKAYENMLHRIWSTHMDYQTRIHAPAIGKKVKTKFPDTFDEAPAYRQSDLWLDRGSGVYRSDGPLRREADGLFDDALLDSRDAADILADLRLPERSLFKDAEVRDAFTSDQQRFSGEKHKKRR
jgi:hypothetical protein